MNDDGLWTDPEHPSLSIMELDRVLRAIERPPIYYLIDRRCQKFTKDGEDGLFGIPIGDKRIAVMHPDLLPQFIAQAEEAGFKPTPFEFEQEYAPMTGKMFAERMLREHMKRLVQWLGPFR